jgi:hypothetical protein
MRNIGARPGLRSLVGGAVLLTLACSGKNKSEDVGEAKPAFSLTASQFTEEFRKDAKAAEAKFDGKVIELTGEATHVGREKDQTIESVDYGIVLLKGIKVGERDWIVGCYMRDKEPWKKAIPGQTVKVKGKWTKPAALLGLFVLLECVIVESSGPRPPALTADELAKEYTIAPTATRKKYAGSYMFLSGEVARIEREKDGGTSVTFKTRAKRPLIRVLFSDETPEAVRNLKVGQKIKTLGQFFLASEPDANQEVVLVLGILYEFLP